MFINSIKLMAAAAVLLALGPGCATGRDYQTSEQYVPYLTDVPPSFYDCDPALRHWFTAPYWDPSSLGE